MLSITVALSVAYSAAVMLFVPPLVRLFSTSDKVTEITVSACVVFHLFFGFYGIQSFLTTMLQSLGRARLSAVLSFARQGYLFIPALLLFPVIYRLQWIVGQSSHR